VFLSFDPLQFALNIPKPSHQAQPESDPAIGKPTDQGSQSDQSLLQLDNGIAVTIQFQPGNNGCNHGIFAYHATLAGQPKHAATPNHQVKVGVANKRKKFEGLSTPKYQPAHVSEHHSLKGLGGHTAGQHTGQYCNQVNAENIGIHSSIFKPSPIGVQNNVGSHPGAKGAQLRGVAIQPPQPKPQLNHCIKLSTPASI
jgi:hypothetical protein